MFSFKTLCHPTFFVCSDLQGTQVICSVMEKKKADGRTVCIIDSIQFVDSVVLNHCCPFLKLHRLL